MSRDAKLKLRFPFRSSSLLVLTAAVIGALATPPFLAQAQDSPSQQAAPSAKSSSGSHAAAQHPSAQQKTFASPQQAAQALYDAARNHDEAAMLAILGPSSRDIVIWTDDTDERHAQDDNFAKKYQQMHRLVQEPDNETTLYVGAENWPLPIPIVNHNGAWYFDSNLGRREIFYRRIGENEMDAIDALHGIIAAENQFDADSGEYARHLNCSQDQHDGLFSPANGTDEDKNPIGPYLAGASCMRSDRIPFHGYFFLILTAQGPHAHGGAHSYIVNEKMTGGFAVVAFPAVYRSSGVKTFIVNQNGMIHEKDLGPKTNEIASKMKAYDPDSTWARVRPTEFLTVTAGTVATPNP
jgi:hypothetical protein